ncbi:MgtC/SapB family protein [Albibacterium bauzanense]|uniref:Putative Mg2+ transporter-C (MgtC) family protein n=1 Tax=Albibacterium bauzanense TaxID=653929 RepID=A0A4R1M2W3_9SPHI|nr:MgtC/SapB family protein [Albibacterium bauzanense]TCK85174.1 putative Mg2+ transporter-C (MgtC) family protein [Albibacterium bauzanense]
MIEIYEIIIRLGCAALCGALIGIERERKEWAAGMRTHMMVAVGSALYMIVSAYGFEEILKHPNVSLDPSRVASQVVSGIGFLGAGTIIFLRHGIIRGLTTASGLWTVAAIGLAVGGGMYWAGLATTAIAITILWLLQPIEALLFSKTNRNLLIHFDSVEDSSAIIDSILQNEEYDIRHFALDRKDNGTLTLKISSIKSKDLKSIAGRISKDPRVKSIDFV